MDMGSDTAESQQAEVVEIPQAEASVSRWSSESKSDSAMVFATQSATDSKLWRCSLSNDANCGIEASMRSTSLSGTFVSVTKAQAADDDDEPSLSHSTWSDTSRSSSPSIASFPATPNDPNAAFATKRLTINTAGCNTGYYRNSVTMKSESSASLCTAMESSSPSEESCTFIDDSELYSKPSSFDEFSDEEMHDDAQFTRVDSAEDDSSSQSDRADSPIMGNLNLGVRDSRAMDIVDSESWRCSNTSSMYKTNNNPWTTAHGPDSQASLIYTNDSTNDNDNDKSCTGGGFYFGPDLGFFGDDESDLTPSWPNLWAPAPHTTDIYLPSSTKPIDIPMPVSSKARTDRKRRKTGFFRFPPRASSSCVQREDTFVYPPSPPAPDHQQMCSTVMAEVVSYGDTSGRSTSWARRGRFGGRLSSRTRKNWLLFSPGKLFGAA